MYVCQGSNKAVDCGWAYLEENIRFVTKILGLEKKHTRLTRFKHTYEPHKLYKLSHYRRSYYVAVLSMQKTVQLYHLNMRFFFVNAKRIELLNRGNSSENE